MTIVRRGIARCGIAQARVDHPGGRDARIIVGDAIRNAAADFPMTVGQGAAPTPNGPQT